MQGTPLKTCVNSESKLRQCSQQLKRLSRPFRCFNFNVGLEGLLEVIQAGKLKCAERVQKLDSRCTAREFLGARSGAEGGR